MELYINAFAHYLPDDRVPNSYFKDVNEKLVFAKMDQQRKE